MRVLECDLATQATRSFLVAIAATVAGLVVSCGVPTHDAEVIAGVPDDVQGSLASSSTTTPLDEDESVGVRFYFHDENERMVRVVRRYPEPPRFQDTLRTLLEGPRDDEQNPPTFIQAAGTPALEPTFIDLDRETGTAFISVADDAGFREDENRRIAAAEIVCTAVQYDNVQGIVISDSQGPIPLTDLGAQPIDGAATAADYDDCVTQLPAPAPTTTPPEE